MISKAFAASAVTRNNKGELPADRRADQFHDPPNALLPVASKITANPLPPSSILQKPSAATAGASFDAHSLMAEEVTQELRKIYGSDEDAIEAFKTYQRTGELPNPGTLCVMRVLASSSSSSSGGSSSSSSSSSCSSFPRHHGPELPADRSKLSSEELFAQYEMDTNAMLGRGAHGVVLRTVHKPTQKRYAMKTGRKNTPTTLHRNRQEGKVLTMLRHENIVQGIEYFETNDAAVLILELAEDGDLLDVVNKRHGISELEAAFITLQLISGLSCAYSQGIVHGDIKLENILVLNATPEQQQRFGTQQRFAFCSWGFAHKHMDGEVVERKYGTLRYLPPEKIMYRSCDHFIDIWGLGVVIYGMVCGQLPFDGNSASEVATQIVRAQPSFPETVSPEFRALITAILRVEPAARPSLEQIREFAWFKTAKSYLARLAAAPKIPPTPASRFPTRSNSAGALSTHLSAPAITVTSPARPSTPSPQATSTPIPMPMAAATPTSLPPIEICTSPLPPSPMINAPQPAKP